jgi:hypothetical protein
MILDRGVCRILHKTSTTPSGGKPTATWAVIHESYYGELSFETAPARPTERREDTKTAARIRILQNRGIRNDDVAELTPFDGTEVKADYYRIARAWHGDDSDSGQPISDLTLEVTEKPNIQKAVTPTQSTGGSSSGSSAGSGSQAPEVSGNDGQ